MPENSNDNQSNSLTPARIADLRNRITSNIPTAKQQFTKAGISEENISKRALINISGALTREQIEKEEAEKLTTTDTLTGLPNRRWWDIELEKRIIEANRKGNKMWIITMDIDNFKSFNDTYGHPNGDRAIQLMALLPSRTGEPIARVGGEEFGQIVNSDVTEEQLATIFKRYQETMKQYSTELMKELNKNYTDHNREEVTVSFGIAQYIVGETAEEVMKRSDNALYEAKRLGRNRAVIAHIENDQVIYRDLSAQPKTDPPTSQAA